MKILYLALWYHSFLGLRWYHPTVLKRREKKYWKKKKKTHWGFWAWRGGNALHYTRIALFNSKVRHKPSPAADFTAHFLLVLDERRVWIDEYCRFTAAKLIPWSCIGEGLSFEVHRQLARPFTTRSPSRFSSFLTASSVFFSSSSRSSLQWSLANSIGRFSVSRYSSERISHDKRIVFAFLIPSIATTGFY